MATTLIPSTLKRYASKIASVDNETAIDNGYWVNLNAGWIVPYDQTHQIHEDTLIQCAAKLQYVERCECTECVAMLGQLPALEPIESAKPKRMTIKQTIQAVRDLGLTCTWRTEVREYRVNLVGGTEATAYYTEDSDDAIGTAKFMVIPKDNPDLSCSECGTPDEHTRNIECAKCYRTSGDCKCKGKG